MQFAHLPIDILSPICAKIYAIDVMHLIMTGSKMIGHNVSHVTRNVVDVAGPFSKFPFSLYQLPQLKDLEIKTIEKLKGSLFVTGSSPIFPHVVRNLINTLKFSFGQSFFVLRDKTLCNYAPNLENLSCTNAIVEFEPSYLENIPPNLKTLVLKYTLSLDPELFKVPIGDFISLLSDRIEYLKINCLEIVENRPDQTGAPTKLPATLRTLQVSYAPPGIISALPKGLIKLSLFLSHETVIKASQLPNSLQFLSLRNAELELDCLMPDLATINTTLSLPTPDAVRFLSPKLTELPQTTGAPLTPGAFPNLQRVVFGAYGGAPLKELHIPSSVKTADFYGKSWKTSHLLQLPSTLVSLTAPVRTFDAFTAFPKTLKELDMESAGKGKQIPLSYWLQLPPSLTDLSCTLDMFADIECISALPKTLESFLLKISGSPLPDSKRGSHATICNDPTLPAHLPPNLKSLSLMIHDMSACVIIEWLENLSHLSSLEALNIFSTDEPKKAIPMHEAIPKLPKTLTTLQMPLDNRTLIEPLALSHFPPTLLQLMLVLTKSPGEEKTIYSNEHFAKLPPSLQNLNVEGSYPSGVSERLTLDLVDLLPPKLIFLYLDDDFKLKSEIEASFKQKKRYLALASSEKP